jgi:hypothetical protein
MKNVTVTLEEDVARWARIWAAEHDTSVSRFLGSILKERMMKDRGYESAMSRYLAREPTPLKKRGQPYPSRAELHDR